MHYPHNQKERPSLALTHFNTFRTHPFPDESSQEGEGEYLLMRVHELERQIGAVNERAMHLQAVNEKLNQIIVNYHTKNNIKLQQFLEKVDHLVHKTYRHPHQNSSNHKQRDALSKSKAKISKSSSIKKVGQYEQMSSFGKVKTQQANSILDENNSFMANVYGGMSRAELKRRLNTKASIQ